MISLVNPFEMDTTAISGAAALSRAFLSNGRETNCIRPKKLRQSESLGRLEGAKSGPSSSLIHLEQPLDIARHDQAEIFDLELQVSLRVFHDLLDLPVHRVEGMIRAVEDPVGPGP